MTEFYQIGGWNNHFRDWNELRKAGGAVFQDAASGKLRLVQGILPNGVTYYLAPRSDSFKPPRQKPPFPSSKYASLSPVIFNSFAHIQAALAPLNEYRGKKRWSDEQDNSTANKRYNGADNRRAEVITGALLKEERPTTAEQILIQRGHAGHQRSAFEHSRVLYQFVHDEIPPSDVELYKNGRHAFLSAKIKPKIAFFSATRTSVLERDRVAHRRDADLVFRDFGWGVLDSDPQADNGGGSGSLREWTSLATAEGFLSGAGVQEEFRGEGVEPQLTEDILPRLRSFFKSLTTGTGLESGGNHQPTILIVSGAQEQIRGLATHGVPIEDWEVGLTTLFDSEAPYYGEMPVRPQERSRSRSLSPVRKPSTTNSRDPRTRPPPPPPPSRDYTSGSGSREAPPAKRPRARTRPPVYVLDILDLWELGTGLSERDARTGTELRKTARQLGRECALDGWCAGNDVRLLYEIWGDLSGGPPIDMCKEEIAQRLARASASHNPPNHTDTTLGAHDDQAPSDDMDEAGNRSYAYALGQGEVAEVSAIPADELADDPYAAFDNDADPYDDD